MVQLNKLPDLDKNDYKPLYIQLSGLLADYIRNNGLDEGAPVPSENELLSRFSISRSTIRQAIQHLEAQDVVRKVRGKGTFVSAPRHRKCFRGFQNLEETLAEQGIILRNVMLSFEEVYPPPAFAGELRLPPGNRAILIRRLKISNSEPLALEERFLPPDVAARFTKEDFREKPVFDVIETQADFEIIRVTYTMTASPLSEEEAMHLNVDSGASVLRRTGVYHGRNGRPLMIGRITFLADKTELRFEFQKEDGIWKIMSMV